MNANPDLEIPTVEGNTPLLRAVKNRNTEIVQLLLEKKAKMTAIDKMGDTALHVAMRARSKVQFCHISKHIIHVVFRR